MEVSNKTKSKTKIKNELIKYLMSANNQHLFNINGIAVKVVFSNETNAPDIESVLVKIASSMGK